MNDPQRDLFLFDDIKFTFDESPSRPQWRNPQRGAPGAVGNGGTPPRPANATPTAALRLPDRTLTAL